MTKGKSLGRQHRKLKCRRYKGGFDISFKMKVRRSQHSGKLSKKEWLEVNEFPAAKTLRRHLNTRVIKG